MPGARGLGQPLQLFPVKADPQPGPFRERDASPHYGHVLARHLLLPEMAPVDVVQDGHGKHGHFMGQEGLVDDAARLLEHEGRIGRLRHGRQLHGMAHRSVAAHETVAEALSHEDVVGAMVNEDGDGALLPQQTIAVAIFGTDGVLDASGDGKLFQFPQHRVDGFEVGVFIEVIVNLEPGGSNLLHGFGLIDGVLQDIHVVFEPVIAAAGYVDNFFRHFFRRPRDGPGRHRNPGAHLGSQELPGGQTQIFPHEVVDGHVHGQVPDVGHPVERIGAKVILEATLPQRAAALSVTLQPQVRPDHVDDACLQGEPVVSKERLGIVVVKGRDHFVLLDLDDLHLSPNRGQHGKGKRSQPRSQGGGLQ